MPAYYDEQRKSWYCKFYYKDSYGQSKTKMKRGFRRKADALQYERKFKLRASGSSDITFKALRESYMEYKQKRIKKENTLRNKRYCINAHIAPYFDDMLIMDISPSDVARWQNRLLDSSKKPSTIGKINAQLSDIFNYGMKFFGLSSNPCVEPIGTQKREPESIDFWTLDEYRAFISHVPDIEFAIVYELLFYSGCRIGELRALTLSDVDFNENTLQIDKTLPRCDDEDTPPKTINSYRTVAMPETVMQDLKEYTRHIYDLTDANRLFFLSYDSISRYKDTVCQENNLRRIRLHDLRHSHVSLLVDMGCDMMAIADRIGDTLATVQNIYAHLYPEKKKIVAEKLNEIVSK